MQPYFFPYAGYYRLLAAADVFLIFDCVQFIRRGRIHRCEVPGPGANVEWLTLPLSPAARATPIDRVQLAADACSRFDTQLRRLPWVAAASGPAANRVRSWLHAPLDGQPLVDYLEFTLRETAALLGLTARIARTSSIALAPELHGQSRVIAAAKAVGATHYINAPGGAALYDANAFARAGLQLSFLQPYEGSFPHILPAMLSRAPSELADDIWKATLLRAA